jgi:hypothetical protein
MYSNAAKVMQEALEEMKGCVQTSTCEIENFKAILASFVEVKTVYGVTMTSADPVKRHLKMKVTELEIEKTTMARQLDECRAELSKYRELRCELEKFLATACTRKPHMPSEEVKRENKTTSPSSPTKALSTIVEAAGSNDSPKEADPVKTCVKTGIGWSEAGNSNPVKQSVSVKTNVGSPKVSNSSTVKQPARPASSKHLGML